jgi:hypothetical protein
LIFESNTFIDEDDDPLTYEAFYSFDNFITKDSLDENRAFWLEFDGTSRRFYGTPNLTNISSNSIGKY